MNYRFLSVVLVLAALLVSCSSAGKAYILEGESESELFLSKGDTLVRVTIPTSEISAYREYSQSEGSDTFNSLFGLESATYATADDEDYARREECYSIIMDETGSESITSMLASFAGDLRKTSFDNTMNEFSEGYDTRGLLKAAGDSTVREEYDLATVLSQSASWEEKERFIKLWTRQILRSR